MQFFKSCSVFFLFFLNPTTSGSARLPTSWQASLSEAFEFYSIQTQIKTLLGIILGNIQVYRERQDAPITKTTGNTEQAVCMCMYVAMKNRTSHAKS